MNTASGFQATVGGGNFNTAGGNSATIAGGIANTANFDRATVGGGGQNTAGDQATVGGGSSNDAGGDAATVGGGIRNIAVGELATVGGGGDNLAGSFATVGGGNFNAAGGNNATVPGGGSNTAAGDFSLAAGRLATIDGAHDGSFLFADDNPVPFNSAAANEFAVRATGGVRFVTAISGTTPTAGATLAAGGGAFMSLSDRNAKEHFRDEDGEEVLSAIAEMPIQSWNYKTQDPSIRHLGPMGQDFSAAFGLGEDDRHINTVDIDGVNLLAVQALEKRTTDLRAEVAGLREENAELLRRLMELEAILRLPATDDFAQK